MVYNAKKHWVSGFYPSFRKLDHVSETCCFLAIRIPDDGQNSDSNLFCMTVSVFLGCNAV
jgi:hypothetical protein